MSGSVLDAIANPKIPQVNFLDLATKGASLGYMGQHIQQMRAQQAAGDAIRSAINPDTGLLDVPQAQKNLLAAGPEASMVAQEFLTNTQSLATSQQTQAEKGRQAIINFVTPLLRKGISDEDLHNGVANGVGALIDQGIVSRNDALASMLRADGDPASLRRELQTLLISANSPTLTQQIYGTGVTGTGAQGQTIGGVKAPEMQGGGISVPPQTGIGGGMSTSDADTIVDVPYPKGHPLYGRTFPMRKGDIMPLLSGSGGSGGTPGSLGGTGGAQGGAGANAGNPLLGGDAGGATDDEIRREFNLPNATAADVAALRQKFNIGPAPGAAPPAPTGGTPGVGIGGAARAGTAQPPAATPAPTPPPAAAPAPATTPAPGKPAFGTSAAPGDVATIEREKASNQEAFIAAQKGFPDQQTRLQNMQHAYDALKIATTGTLEERKSAARQFMYGLGLLPDPNTDKETAYELFRKYTEKTIADLGNAGGTDIARNVAAQSNAGVSLINPANLAVLRNDIAKQRQNMAAYMTAPDKEKGQGFLNHSTNVANLDTRGFFWDEYSPAEQSDILKSVGPENSPKHKALARAIGLGHSLPYGATGGPVVPYTQPQGAAPAPAPTPPPIVRSPRAMLTPQNFLAVG